MGLKICAFYMCVNVCVCVNVRIVSVYINVCVNGFENMCILQVCVNECVCGCSYIKENLLLLTEELNNKCVVNCVCKCVFVNVYV